MSSERDAFDQAFRQLWHRKMIRVAGKSVALAFLIREQDWRPLSAPWWTGKQVSVIGADVDGNFLLRHSDGSVRYWDHGAKTDTLVAKSVNTFAEQIEHDG